VSLLEKYPRAIWLGALALIWTAAEMILDEPAIRIRDAIPWSAELVLSAVFLGLIVAARSAVQARRAAAVH
jgi:predicted tellurium resistance membrane protein TerC